ncbi:hypothetical protein [Haloferax marisrubri]|uniref:Uncharacterized protein n=1 Tax=Haloferax marisrubri TaxID=1544719 RepID=A0A2P4NQX6_9EURY|nr:hypothetical protein [Haloferax marisrubri]POG55555.1 hypothetical protein AUR65_009125 [Haloferax marisrubri]
MTDDEQNAPPDAAVGRLDVPTLQTLAQRAATHPLVVDWSFDPSSLSPRRLQLSLDAHAYPERVATARLDIRWFTSGDYSVHYLELGQDDGDGPQYHCRWDRHPKPTAPRTHFHPPPDAGTAEPSSLEPHHLEVLFTALDWIRERVEQSHGTT